MDQIYFFTSKVHLMCHGTSKWAPRMEIKIFMCTICAALHKSLHFSISPSLHVVISLKITKSSSGRFSSNNRDLPLPPPSAASLSGFTAEYPHPHTNSTVTALTHRTSSGIQHPSTPCITIEWDFDSWLCDLTQDISSISNPFLCAAVFFKDTAR